MNYYNMKYFVKKYGVGIHRKNLMGKIIFFKIKGIDLKTWPWTRLKLVPHLQQKKNRQR